MTTPATDSAIDVAYWFFNRADKDGFYLETEKMQVLLFLSQVHFAMAKKAQILVPSTFICDKDGFFEPNLRRLFAQGRPFMTPVSLPKEVNLFLEQIWQKYGNISQYRLDSFIKNHIAFKKHYVQGTINIVDLNVVIKDFLTTDSVHTSRSVLPAGGKKVMLSQSGQPVVVSQWKPRKLDC